MLLIYTLGSLGIGLLFKWIDTNLIVNESVLESKAKPTADNPTVMIALWHLLEFHDYKFGSAITIVT